jgi:tetratricopeptide (TPR) repeat protein
MAAALALGAVLSVHATGAALVPRQAAAAADPAYPFLERAYRELKASNLDEAAAAFEQALKLAPDRIQAHKDLAFTYIKMGETAKVVGEFEVIERLDPRDFRNLLSLGFLYFETRREDRALEMFERAAQSPDPEVRQTAGERLAAIRRDYQAQIHRWEQAVQLNPGNVSTRLELGGLYRKNREYRRAIEQYQAARRLMPRDSQTLLELARLYEQVDERASARAFYLLAWRSPDPRASELGRAGLGSGYPAPGDFLHALEFDPGNGTVRRDLAYLYLNLRQPALAIGHFEKIVAAEPEDWQSVLQLAFAYLEAGREREALPLLDGVIKSGTPDQARKASEALLRLRSRGQGKAAGETPDQEQQALTQVARGFAALAGNRLRAAAEIFEGAYQLDPGLDAIALRLGWIYNMLEQDVVAVHWFRRAAASADPRVAGEAAHAAHNLQPTLRNVVGSFWANPVVSSRWQNLFGYAQWKLELRSKRLPFRPYLSLRLNSDLRTRSEAVSPLFFSDGGVTLGAGVFVQPRRDLTAWAEAGNLVSYYARPVPGTGRFYPDYRAGLTWFRSFGPALFTDLPGYRRFADAAVANLFISRYSNDLFHYVQTRAGYHLPRQGLLNAQAFLAANYVRDLRGFYWANFVEIGPGLAFGLRSFPQMQTSVGLFRGVYRQNEGNPRRPNFLDFRVSIWYSRSF